MTQMTNPIDLRNERSKAATIQQVSAAIPTKSVWVQASAGTGKTKVLSDRFLRLLLNGEDASKILCLTYTKAAAVEMANRITKRLTEWAVASDEKLETELNKLFGRVLGNKELDNLKNIARCQFALLLETPNGVKIQTIHSFCQEILKRFPIEAGISPYFNVMEERNAAEIIKNAKEKIFNDIKLNPSSNLAKALDIITSSTSEYSFNEIMDSITKNNDKIKRLVIHYGGQEKVLQNLARDLGVNADDTKESLISPILNNIDKTWLLEQAKIMENMKTKTDNVFAKSIFQFLEEGDFNDYILSFLTKENKIRQKLPTKSVRENYPNIGEWFDEEAEKILELIDRLRSLKIYNCSKAIFDFSFALLDEYENIKNYKSQYDFTDLIVKTRNLLENPEVANWVLYKLDGGIDNILIDEAQDTAPDQWAIIKGLTEDFFSGISRSNKQKTIFAVGDKKQSIYSFQNADPQHFIDMGAHYKDAVEKSQSEWEKLSLQISFRSTKSVLDCVNMVFSTDSMAKNGVVEEGEDITHLPFKAGDAGRVELWPLVSSKDEKKELEFTPPNSRISIDSTSSRLAKLISLKIHDMIKNKEMLPSKNRPVTASDFLILVQTRSNFTTELVRELKRLNVNTAGLDRVKLSTHIAIQDLISLAEFLLQKNDDLSLAEVLKSPIFNLSEDDLYDLCYKRTSTLWVNLGNKKDHKEIYNKAYHNLKDLLDITDFVRPYELFEYVLTSLNARKNMVSRLGNEAEDVLNEFLNLCLSFEQNHVPTLQGFLSWMKAAEVEVKRDMEQSDLDAVRIMTVHGSKGLQAPIVIIPDMYKAKDRKREKLLWKKSENTPMMYWAPYAEDYNNYCNEIFDINHSSLKDEYNRLLYVALTRAEDRLYLCGHTGKKAYKEDKDCWYNFVKTSLSKYTNPITDKFLSSNDALIDESEILVIENEQSYFEDKKPVEAQKTAHQEVEIPSWLTTRPNDEPTPPKPLTPSKPEDEEPFTTSPLHLDDGYRYKRGNIIHKLLEILTLDNNTGDKHKIIDEYIAINASDISNKSQDRIKQEILSIIDNPNYDYLFASNSKAEVPVMGLIGDKVISGQIDRLIELEDEVIILDYKTNTPAPFDIKDVPLAYIKQLSAYKSVLQRIYKDKDVRATILWTSIPNIMEIPEELLSKYQVKE